MKYQEMAKEMIRLVGGKENIKSVTHCVTRVRFVLKDNDKADTEAIKNLDDVITCQISSGQYQVVVGPIVKDVYQAVAEELGEMESMPAESEVKEEHKRKTIKDLGKDALDTLVSCFVPAIPAIAGSGMIKVLVVLLCSIGVLDSASTTYTILNTIGDAIFYFLPFIVAINAAKKMEVDLFLSVILAAVLMHPNFTGLASIEGGATFLGLHVNILDYSSQALPLIFGVWLLKYVDKFADKISPNIVKVFLRPMIDLLIVAPILMFIIGPISGVLTKLSKNSPILYRWWDELQKPEKNTCSFLAFMLYLYQSII